MNTDSLAFSSLPGPAATAPGRSDTGTAARRARRTAGGPLHGALARMGPAWIISAVACGPATMASVAMSGSAYGYALLWVVVLSAVFACTAQYMAAKAGIIAGKGIVAVVRERFGRGLAWVLLADALICTWLAAAVLLKAFAAVTALVTGFDAPWLPVLYAAGFYLLTGVGGYKALETFCKLLVAVVVGCFVVTLGVAAPSVPGALTGLVPSLPGGGAGALMSAGIMGGAVHITIIAMHTYTVNARGWTVEDAPLARTDTVLSMLVAFGLYSVAIFLCGAAVLHPLHAEVKNAFDLAATLRPLLGPWAGAVFLAGMWGAVVTTIAPTYLAGAYLLADAAGWEPSVRDRRFRLAVLAGCLVSLLGPLYHGGFLVLLVTMLALGLCGTPLILGLLLVLLNSRAWAGRLANGLALNVLGGAALAVTTLLAARFALAKLGVL
ncbi:MAG: divalent metal cation transporter [Desulfovibrionaceae bacterium]|jgi:manganese transport protein|nr:divalent metal cation transporter [Desulfovibrionaceae bacterium]